LNEPAPKRGASDEERQAKRKLQIGLTLCLLAAAAMPPVSLAAQNTYEGPGWTMPEDAVLHYLEGFKEQDIGKMISAYATESYQERLKATAALSGADEVRGVVAFFRMDDTVCVLACDAIRYGERWFMHRSNGSIGALMALDPTPGGVLSVSKDDLMNRFEELDTRTRDIFGGLRSDLH